MYLKVYRGFSLFRVAGPNVPFASAPVHEEVRLESAAGLLVLRLAPCAVVDRYPDRGVYDVRELDFLKTYYVVCFDVFGAAGEVVCL